MGLNSADPIIVAPGEESSPDVLDRLGRRLLGHSPEITPARRLQARRATILDENVAGLAWEKLKEQFSSPRSREVIEPHVSDLYNPAADIVERLCRVYRHGVTRSFSGTKRKQKALLRLFAEAGIRQLAPEWNRQAYFVGPVFVYPVVRGDRMVAETIAPHQRELVLSAEDPCGRPLAVAWKTARGTMVLARASGSAEYRLEPDGHVVPTGASLESDAAHEGATAIPCLRFVPALTPEDWDRSRCHERLTAATIDAAAVAAVMGNVRQTQNKWLLFLSGFLESIPKGQNLAMPHLPVVFPTREGQQVTLDALNFDTPPKNFIDHIRFIYAVAAESTGVPAMISADGTEIDLEFAYDGVSEIREEQIQDAAPFEVALAIAMVEAARAGGHPVAADLPSADEIRSRYRTTFGRMSRRFADPQQQRDQADWEVRHGLTSIADLLASKYPEVDREELMDQIRKTLAENAELWDMLAAHQVGPDAAGKVITSSEQNGAKGPAARDGKAKAGQ